jgi:ribosomal protein S15P/S13E
MMAKYKRNVQQVVEFGGYFTRDTFLSTQDIQNITRKLMIKTYNKHENDAKNVRMWVQENPNLLLYYQKTGVEVGGKLIGENMPFIIGIQSPYQIKMMIQYSQMGLR